MPRFAVIDAPSVLGLKPNGVERLPEALKAAGLLAGLHAEYAGRVEPPPYSPRRDPKTQISIRTHSELMPLQLAAVVAGVLRQGEIPACARRRLQQHHRHHARAQTGREVRALLHRRSRRLLSAGSRAEWRSGLDGFGDCLGQRSCGADSLDGVKPLVRDEDIVAFGFRDAEESRQDGSQDIRGTAIDAFELHKVRELGAAVAAEQTARILQRDGVEGFWIHIDADVLDDAVMPAGGLRLGGWVQLGGAERDIACIDGNGSRGWSERRHLQPCLRQGWFDRARIGLVPSRRSVIRRERELYGRCRRRWARVLRNV